MTDSQAEASPGGQTRTQRRDRLVARIGLSILYVIAFGIAQWLLTMLTVVQVIHLGVTGRENEHIQGFGRSLAIWLAEVTGYLTGATTRRPFPLAAWPKP